MYVWVSSQLSTPLTGAEWNALSEDDQIALAPAVGVFAEATPLDKSSFIRALKASGEVVGACANCQEDYQVAHAAHLVFGTQQQGQQCMRAHADIVCLDDSFSSVVAAVIRGRRFRANFNSYLEFRITLVCVCVSVCVRACVCACACKYVYTIYTILPHTHTHTHTHT
jgi:P-type Ca2+ transporter type 2C